MCVETVTRLCGAARHMHKPTHNTHHYFHSKPKTHNSTSALALRMKHVHKQKTLNLLSSPHTLNLPKQNFNKITIFQSMRTMKNRANTQNNQMSNKNENSRNEKN